MASLCVLMFAQEVLARSPIVEIDYNENSIIRLKACVNFQTTIIFADNEHVENVGLGDANQWQVMPNKRGNLLFVKPLSAKSYSNMTVVSDRHSYSFELSMERESVCRSGNITYSLRFHYPELKPKPTNLPTTGAQNQSSIPEKNNSHFSYTGARDIVPLRVFDDGKSTFFKWAEGVSIPAIYAIGPDNHESVINFSNQGDYIVVEMVAKAFSLRRGDLMATLYNDAYGEVINDAQSPQPHTKKAKTVPKPSKAPMRESLEGTHR